MASRARPAAVLVALLAVASACSEESAPPPDGGPAVRDEEPQEPSETGRVVLARRGRQVYMANCIACHNPDPTRAGAIGPALAGSSEELLRYKVLRNEYPPGYTPKREGGGMIALPHLENEIAALAAYLGEAADASDAAASGG